jgi:hypothetical protein
MRREGRSGSPTKAKSSNPARRPAAVIEAPAIQPRDWGSAILEHMKSTTAPIE